MEDSYRLVSASSAEGVKFNSSRQRPRIKYLRTSYLQVSERQYQADAEWKKVKADSETNGALANHIDSYFMDPTGVSALR